MKKLNLKNVKTFSHKNGKIIVFQKSKDIQFKFKRVFVVKSTRIILEENMPIKNVFNY